MTVFRRSLRMVAEMSTRVAWSAEELCGESCMKRGPWRRLDVSRPFVAADVDGEAEARAREAAGGDRGEASSSAGAGCWRKTELLT